MSDYVLDLIKKQGLTYKLSGKDYLIACLNPDHDDSNPSFRVDKITGISHCFSCGYKVNIFKHYGVVANFTSIKIAKLKDKLRNLHIDFNGVDFPEEMVPMLKPFRGITAKTLKEFGAFYTHGSEKLQDRIFFPIKDVRGKNIVYVGRHMMSQGNPRYLNYPTGVTMPIFPAFLIVSFASGSSIECGLIRSVSQLIGLVKVISRPPRILVVSNVKAPFSLSCASITKAISAASRIPLAKRASPVASI